MAKLNRKREEELYKAVDPSTLTKVLDRWGCIHYVPSPELWKEGRLIPCYHRDGRRMVGLVKNHPRMKSYYSHDHIHPSNIQTKGE